MQEKQPTQRGLLLCMHATRFGRRKKQSALHLEHGGPMSIAKGQPPTAIPPSLAHASNTQAHRPPGGTESVEGVLVLTERSTGAFRDLAAASTDLRRSEVTAATAGLPPAPAPAASPGPAPGLGVPHPAGLVLAAPEGLPGPASLAAASMPEEMADIHSLFAVAEGAVK